MRIIRKTYDNAQKNLIKELSDCVGILYSTAEILYGRGFDTREKILDFLSPENWVPISPFTMSGMEDAVNRIKLAKENGETVVVYGDYDVDGICATTVLYRALKVFGIDAFTVIPERQNGYGLTEGVINEVLDNYFPDLVITVDCGISAKKEVEYLNDLGVDVIITDHHELPEELPQTTIVSTKTKGQEYPYDNLSGAGVAYKLACALIGDRANDYLDLVALATIADSMPLVGENRNIVYHGVELIKNGRCSKAVTGLLYSSGAKDISSVGLSFSVAPKINAAGRMGDAYSALKLFLTESQQERDSLIERLCRYNVDRQQECETLYQSAKNKLKTHGNYGHSIVLYDKDWMNGMLGIVAARLTEEYGLPTVLFSEIDGLLHGSARSIGDVSVYDAISSASGVLIDFGGHSQAAGVTVSEENFEAFANAFNDYISTRYEQVSFDKTIEVDYVLSSPFTLRFAKEIAKFEPFGLGNKKPIILTVEEEVTARPIKAGSTHLNVKTPKIEITSFNGLKYLEPLNSNAIKNVFFESSINAYNGREYAKGILKAVDFEYNESKEFTLLSLKNALNSIKGNKNDHCVNIHGDALEEIINKTHVSGRGTLFVVTNPENYLKYDGLKKFTFCPLSLTVTGGKNAVLVGGNLLEVELSPYDNVVYVDRPFKVLGIGKKVYQNSLNSFEIPFKTQREEMILTFRLITKFLNKDKTWLEICDESGDETQVAFCLETFKELGFIVENQFVYKVDGVKKDLLESSIYSYFVEK